MLNNIINCFRGFPAQRWRNPLFLFTILAVFFLPRFAYSTELRIVFWNLKNFFDTQDDPEKDDTLMNADDYRSKLERAALVFKEMDADIAGVCEVENIGVLKELAAKAGYPYYYLIEGNDPRGIDIGLMSRIPVRFYQSNKDRLMPYRENSSYKPSRDFPHALFEVNGFRFHLLLVHLKSKVYGEFYSEPKRIAQSQGLIEIIGDIYRSEKFPAVMAIGDFNSERYSEPLNLLSKAGMSILNYEKTQNGFYTVRYKKNKSDLDYMMINPPMKEKIRIMEYKTVNNREIEAISDHYPVVLRFSVR